jgi:hypothetical protein
MPPAKDTLEASLQHMEGDKMHPACKSLQELEALLMLVT